MFRANNQTFVDDGFPHSNRSIGNVSDLERRDLDIVWLRPQQIVTRDGMKYPWSVFNDPQPTDIEQGHVGNCWAIAGKTDGGAYSTRTSVFSTGRYRGAAGHPRQDHAHKDLRSVRRLPNSVCLVHCELVRSKRPFYRLCIDGIWQTVVVDDFFPCHRRSHTMIFAVGRKNQVGVPLRAVISRPVLVPSEQNKNNRSTNGTEPELHVNSVVVLQFCSTERSKNKQE